MHMRSLPTAALALALLLAAAPALAERALSGSASYRARIALPPEAVLVIEVRDGAGGLLARARLPGRGAQVPLAFTLQAPEQALSLRAGITVGGAPLWLGPPVAVAEGTVPVDLGTLMLDPFRPMGLAGPLDCGAVALELGLGGDARAETAALLRIGPRVVALAADPAAPATRFADPADPGTSVWLRGEAVTVSLGGTVLPECSRPLPAAGPFRARGHEPSWSAEIGAGRIRLAGAALAKAGQAEAGAETGTEAEAEAARDDGAALRRYRLADGSAVVTVAEATCRDSMSGMPYTAQVTVTTATQRLTGCGGDPGALLRGPPWRVHTLDGAPVTAAAGLMLQFLGGGRVAGHGGCNRFAGPWRISGEGLGLGPFAGTMMACAEDRMTLERGFHAALARVNRFDIGADGTLMLLAGDTVVISAGF